MTLQDLQQTASVWQRFNDALSRMSPEQLQYIDKDEESIRMKTDLKALFSEWLFEKYKNDFVMIPEFEQKAQEYVDRLSAAAQEFSARQAGMLKENEELRRRIAELEKSAGGVTL